MTKVHILVLFSLLLSSCASATPIPELMITSTSTAIPLPLQTETPSPTSTQTLAPTLTLTPTLLPDENFYEFYNSVTLEHREIIKQGFQIARFYIRNYYESDFVAGVHTIVTHQNTAKEESFYSISTAQNPFGFIRFDTGGETWENCPTVDVASQCYGLIVHAYIHAWQFQRGCHGDNFNNPRLPTAFLIQGYADYTGKIVGGIDLNDRLFSNNFALFFWPVDEYDEVKWFDNTDVNRIAVKHLVEEYGLETYTEYCDALGHGAEPNDAFQSAYGISIFNFRAQFMDEVLGYYKDCTLATCGKFDWDRGDQFKALLDPTGEISLNARFFNADGSPTFVNTIMVCKMETSNPSYCTGISSTGVPSNFETSLIPGVYMFAFCDPYSPHRETGCLGGAYQTDWFEIVDGQETALELHVPPLIEDISLAEPNLTVEFLDPNGNPIPDFPVTICNYDSPVMACSINPDEPGYKHTNSEGVFEGSFRNGKYLIRFAWPNSASSSYTLPLYEISNINISETSRTAITYQFPKPNMIIKFTNANGITVPLQGFLLCKAIEELGNCLITSANPWGWWVSTNDKGLFEGFLEPGDYFILTNIDLTSLEDRVDFKIPFTVASETDVVSIEYQLIR